MVMYTKVKSKEQKVEQGRGRREREKGTHRDPLHCSVTHCNTW